MRKILAIGLDAAEHSLIERWAGDGSLPNLKRLLSTGAYGTVSSFGKYLTASLWYSLYLGQLPGVHGLYSYHCWRPAEMKSIPPSEKWISVTPFWHRLQEGDPRALIWNVPYSFVSMPFNGIEVMSLAGDHGFRPLFSYPPGFAKQVETDFGHVHFPEENYGTMTLREFLKTRDDMIHVAHRLRDIYASMMRREQWDLFLAVFPMLHRAGHRLWAINNITDLSSAQEEGEALDALRQVYMAADQTIGDLWREAGEETILLIFSNAGMEHNHSREWIFPEMLRRILDSEGNGRPAAKKPTVWDMLRALVPLRVRHKIKAALPLSWRQRLAVFWRMGQIDFTRTRAFTIFLEVQSGVRINLKGREALGIVEPGREYDELCRKIIRDLHTFVDADTGKPLVQEVHFSRDIFQGERVDLLPDLLVIWDDSDAAANHRLITSHIHGDIPWPTPHQNPEGRSGNHNAEGFLIAYGDGIQRGPIENASIIDLAPTILSLLGQPVPEEMQGRALPLQGP